MLRDKDYKKQSMLSYWLFIRKKNVIVNEQSQSVDHRLDNLNNKKKKFERKKYFFFVAKKKQNKKIDLKEQVFNFFFSPVQECVLINK